MTKLLNIAIPTYNRKEQLKYSLDILVQQIDSKYESLVDIFISDDCSTDGTEKCIEEYSRKFEFIKYRRYAENIGLEKNLIQSTDWCDGKYLWIFGDDDFLCCDNAISEIINHLKSGEYQFYILNRTRKSFDLKNNISDNWMELRSDKNIEYENLREFCKKWGIISIIGFISVNIFIREKFRLVNFHKYYGIMYPQLGCMLEAFYNDKCLLISTPLVCHRTQTLEEKRRALGGKKLEKSFMSDYEMRDAIYFSFRLIKFIKELIKAGALSYDDVSIIKEYVFSNIYLKSFIIRNIEIYLKKKIKTDIETINEAERFFKMIDMKNEERKQVALMLTDLKSNKSLNNKELTISVITPSYNQGEFIRDCIDSVRMQTIKPIEHLVYDPGSSDESLSVLKEYECITLINESDSGQSDAVNKGIQRAKGDIIAWINADDYYFNENVFKTVLQRFKMDDSPDIVYGKGEYVDEKREKLRDVYINKAPETLKWRLQQEDGILQPALFIKREVFERIGLLSDHLHYCMDYEFWIRCNKNEIKFAYIDKNLACARYHIKNKTYGQRGKSYEEVSDMLRQKYGYVNHNWLKRYAEFLTEGFDGVLEHSGNTAINKPASVKEHYINLLKAYNANYDSIKKISDNRTAMGYMDTAKEMHRYDIKGAVHCHEIAMDKIQVEKHVCYTVGERRFAFDAEWKKREIEKTHNLLRELIRNRKNDACIIVGNGPSLKKTDFKLFKNQDLIVSNNAFLDSELISYAKYYTVVNYLVAEQGFHKINLIENVYKIFPYWLSYCLNSGNNTFFIDAVGYPKFSTNIFENVSWRHTVSFYNMHLAYGLGYKKVILVGFDHNYRQQDGCKEGEIIHSYEDDENHFAKEYFKGKKWQAANVVKMEEMYKLANEAFKRDNREIVNCTAGGKLELFRRGDLAAELKDVIKVAGEISVQQDSFSRTLGNNNETEELLVGPYERNAEVRIDENYVVHQLLKKIKKSNVVFDVGAHHGHTVIPYAKEQWNIHAFEPDPENLKILDSRTKIYKNVKINNCAVSDENKENQCFYSSDESTGISSLLKFRKSHKEKCRINTITLESYLEKNKVDSIDLLKIDTEGNEYKVLKGFPWKKIKPQVIIAEFEDRKTKQIGIDFHELAAYIKDKGYNLYISEWHQIIRYGNKHEWCRLTKYPCELLSENSWGNIIAIDESVDNIGIEVQIVKIYKKMVNNKRIVFNKIKNTIKKIFKNKPMRLKKIDYQFKIFYAKSSEYLLYNHKKIGKILQIFVRAIRDAKENYSRYLKVFIGAIVLFCTISLFSSKLRVPMLLFAIGITAFALLLIICIYCLKVINNKRNEFERKIERCLNRIKKFENKFDYHEKQIMELKRNVNSNKDQLNNSKERLQNKIQLLVNNSNRLAQDYKELKNDIMYYEKGLHQYFNRRINVDFLSRLEDSLNNGILKKDTLNKNNINYLSYYICQLEKRCKGRLAGNIEDIVLRTMFVQSYNKEKIKIIEIGSLFGIQLAILYNCCRGIFKNIKIFAIDPLDGYYEHGKRDILTNEYVNKEIFKHNMRISDISENDICLINDFSSSESTLRIAKEHEYDVLIIDGDHSYKGVKEDFENYCELVCKNGLIIFDDYHSNEWPDITRYIDEEVMRSDKVEFLYSDYRSCFFKRV